MPVQFGWPGLPGWAEPRCAVDRIERSSSANVCYGLPPSQTGCAADFGNSSTCCRQKGHVGLADQCQRDHPTCVNYSHGRHAGTCTGSPLPPPPPLSGTRIVLREQAYLSLVNKPYHSLNTVLPRWVENVRSHLKTPGQWYFDGAKGEVLYYPRPGERVAELERIIAAEETLVLHNGASAQQWSGITFEFATWLRLMEDAGYAEMQSGVCNVCDSYDRGKDGCGKRDSGLVIPGNVVITHPRRSRSTNARFSILERSPPAR